VAYKDPKKKSEAERRWRTANVEKYRKIAREWAAAKRRREKGETHLMRVRKNNKELREQDPEKYREIAAAHNKDVQAAYRDRHRNRVRQRNREWARKDYAAHPEKHRAASRLNWETHKNVYLERGRRWRAANPEKMRENHRRWREANPEAVALSNRKRYWKSSTAVRRMESTLALMTLEGLLNDRISIASKQTTD
jgi:hypothetical protein